MDNPAFIIAFFLIFLFSIYLGFVVGNHAGERAVTARRYWMYNLIAAVACILATALLTLLPLLCSAPLGFLAGCFTGLKIGFGESSGPWKLLDRFFNVNRAQRARAERGTGEAARRARKSGKELDLISVVDDASGRGSSSSRSERSKKNRNTRTKR